MFVWTLLEYAICKSIEKHELNPNRTWYEWNYLFIFPGNTIPFSTLCPGGQLSRMLMSRNTLSRLHIPEKGNSESLQNLARDLISI